MNLPVIDTTRTEFGFDRTVCSCEKCTTFCRTLPGFLVPADLERIRYHVADAADIYVVAELCLLASPGAVVMRAGELFRIPTIVPARKTVGDLFRGGPGECVFLDAGQCMIHPVAPYGCAFFDEHTPKAEADRRAQAGLHAVLKAWVDNSMYAHVWRHLDEAGLRAKPPEECRRPR